MKNPNVQKHEMIDFYLYSFTKAEEQEGFLFCYEGQHPSFVQPLPPEPLPIKDIEINHLKAYSVKWKDSDHLFHWEVVIEVSPHSFVHFWYSGLSKEMKELADNIIYSLEVRQ